MQWLWIWMWLHVHNMRTTELLNIQICEPMKSTCFQNKIIFVAWQDKPRQSQANQGNANQIVQHFFFLVQYHSFVPYTAPASIYVFGHQLSFFSSFLVLRNKNIGIFNESNILSQCCMIIILLFSCYLSTFELEFRN